MRVFLGLAEVSGFYSNLKKGFDAIGVQAELVTLTRHRFGYEDPHRSIWIRMAQEAVAGRIRHRDASTPVRLAWSALAGMTRALLLVWALLRFDVFVFCCATSFFRFRELPLLKFLGKKIIYNFHGTDGRCGFMDGFAEDTYLPAAMREGNGYIGPLRDTDSEEVKACKLDAYAAITAARKANLDRIDRYADVVINSPSHGQHHTRPFVQRLIVGMPYMPDRALLAQQPAPRESQEVTILHSPSYPEGKGTPGIRAAVAALQAKGHKIRFIEITGRPNREVLELIAQCDFVIDQLYSDMAMVGFATEAAFFGKPAVVGGYYAAHQAADIAYEWIPPTLFCLPEDIEAAIEKLVVDAEFRCILGARASEFVESRWLASRSAERILALARGDFPAEWLYDPAHCDYIHGMGMSKQNMQRVMRGMLERHGKPAFGLSDKPGMEKLIQQFAGTPTLASK
jgi:hypothetical protein